MLLHCLKCDVAYNDYVYQKCPYCGEIGVKFDELTSKKESSLKHENNIPSNTKRKSQDPFKTMEDLLDRISIEYVGEEIFSEENHSRLNKALMALDESFEPEKDWLLIANMKRIPQKLYAVMDSTQSEKQVMVETCRDTLTSLTLDEDVCEKIVQAYMSILGIDAEVRKKAVIEKKIKEENVVIRYKKSLYGSEWMQKEYQYKTCIIGNQEWFAENFHEDYGRNKEYDNYSTLYYNHIGELCDFGRLYDWHEAVKNAPQGWRLPTIEDYQKLVAYIQSFELNAGTALKSTEHWLGSAEKCSDLFGFCAYPTKNDSKTGEAEAWFWTASESGYNDYPHACVCLNENSNDVNLQSRASDGYHACVRYVRDVE